MTESYLVVRYLDEIDHPEYVAVYTDRERAERKARTYKNAHVFTLTHYKDRA